MKTAEEVQGGRLAPSLLMLAATLIALLLLRAGTDLVAVERPGLILAWVAVVLLPTLAFAGVRWDPLPAYARTFLFGSGLFLGIYFAIEPFDIPYAALGPEHIASRFHASGRWVGLVLAVGGLALRRPALIFGSAMWLWMMRELHETLTGFYFSTLDIRNVAEVLAFVAAGAALLLAARRLPKLAAAIELDEQTATRAILLLIAAGIGGHLGNYLYSGLAKLVLDGGPLSWLLGNQLFDGVPGALEKGTLPVAASPWLTQFVYQALILFAIPMNVAAFLMQIIAPVACTRRRWLIAATIGYDLFHIAVYLALGLLFWKWIALNLIIVATLVRMTDAQWRNGGAMTALVFCIGGLVFFRTATLAWYDSPGFASPYFVAEMDDGSRHRLPNAFFRSSSYQVSQGRIWWPGGEGHFNPSIWGSVLHWQDNLAGRHCQVPERAEPAEPKWGPPEVVARFVAAHHRKMLPRLDEHGRMNYRWLPHHHLPSPFLPDPVASLDKRRIATYIYVVDSVCLSMRDGQLQRRVLKRTELPVYDTRADRLLP